MLIFEDDENCEDTDRKHACEDDLYREMEEEEQEYKEMLQMDEDELEKNKIENYRDDLFYLKNHLVEQGKLCKNAKKNLNKMKEIIADYPESAELLQKWGFLVDESFYLLRSPGYFDTALGISKSIIQTTGELPLEYQKIDFLFFLTEKLYESGAYDAQIHDNNMDYINDNIDHLNDNIDHLNDNTFNIIPDRAKKIVEFITEIIKLKRSIVSILYEIGFFTLANALICYEVCRMYNEIYRDIYCTPSSSTSENSQSQINYTSNEQENKRQQFYNSKEMAIEIQRKQFDPEVILREKRVIEYKLVRRECRGSVYRKIYDECHNIKQFLLLSFKDSCNLVLYTSFSTCSEDQNQLINFRLMTDEIKELLKSKDPKALLYYRNYLERGGEAEREMVSTIIQMIDGGSEGIPAIECLNRMMDVILDNPKFLRQMTESKIRKVFEALEYSGEHSTVVFQVIQFFYDLLDKRMFYKPSYLILVRNAGNGEFSRRYLKEFYEYLCYRDTAMGEVLLPVEKKSSSSTVNLNINDVNINDVNINDVDIPDANINDGDIGVVDEAIGGKNNATDLTTRFENIKQSVRIKKGRIDSDE